jgi:hypothetical protein
MADETDPRGPTPDPDHPGWEDVAQTEAVLEAVLTAAASLIPEDVMVVAVIAHRGGPSTFAAVNGSGAEARTALVELAAAIAEREGIGQLVLMPKGGQG